MKHTEWTERTAFEMALLLEGSGEDLTDIMRRNNLTPKDVAEYNKDRVFLNKVSEYRGAIQKDGLLFKMKARVQAEELLRTSYVMIHHPDVPPSVKADLIKSTVKWAGLDTPPPQLGLEGGGGVSITINLNGDTSKKETITLEHNAPRLINDFDDV
jgi:hypothetical protein